MKTSPGSAICMGSGIACLASIVACYAKRAAVAKRVCARAGACMGEEDIFESLRLEMVAEVAAEVAVFEQQLGCAALARPVMEVLASVPRHAFVPAEVQPFSYLNSPL